MEMFNGIFEAFATGGIWMIMILVVHIVSLALMIERALFLYKLRKTNQKTIIQKFENDMRAGEFEKIASQTVNFTSHNPIGRVTYEGVQAVLASGGREEIQAKMDEVLLYENAKLTSKIGYLAMLANVGTLLGLLGTIIGLIQAFGSVSGGQVDPAEKALLLTRGITLAMNTTAYGLIMAIPALIVYAILQNRSNDLIDDLNQASLRVFNWLSFSYETKTKNTIRKKI